MVWKIPIWTSLKDSSRSGRPTEIDSDQIKVLVGENPCETARDIIDYLWISHAEVLEYLHKVSYVNRLGVWVLHPLNVAQRNGPGFVLR